MNKRPGYTIAAAGLLLLLACALLNAIGVDAPFVGFMAIAGAFMVGGGAVMASDLEDRV